MTESIGNIEDFYEEKNFEWEVTDFFSVAKNKDYIKSPAFFFGNSTFYVDMVPNSRSKPGFSVLFLNTVKDCGYFVEYHFALKRLDGTVETLSKNFLKKGVRSSDPMYFKPLETQQQKCEEAALNVLSITCKLKRGRTNFDQDSMLNESKLVELINLDSLSDNLRDLLANKQSCDTTLHVQDREYKAHRALLIARSPVFAAMFLHETAEKQIGIVTIPDCDPESFEEFLKFIYCGKLDKPSSSGAIHLYQTADKYEILELKTFCVEYLMDSLTVENICDVVTFADKYGEEILLNAAQCFFNKNFNRILQTPEWDCLARSNYCLSKRLLLEMSKVKFVL